MSAPQDYELAFNVALPALTKHAEQRALRLGCLVVFLIVS